jgi:epoxyqueuosine reductase
VRGAAVWALSRLLPADDFAAFAARFRPSEIDADVADEWTAALEGRA